MIIYAICFTKVEMNKTNVLLFPQSFLHTAKNIIKLFIIIYPCRLWDPKRIQTSSWSCEQTK